MNPDGNFGVWVLICDCRLTCKYLDMIADIENGEGFTGIGKELLHVNIYISSGHINIKLR